MKQTEAQFGPASICQPIRPPERGAAMMCKSIGSAIERAMVEGKYTQESLAPRMGISRGYLNLLISGKRKANVTHVLRCVRATGSLVPVQWICKEIGGDLDWDELDAEERAAEQRLAEIRATKARERRAA